MEAFSSQLSLPAFLQAHPEQGRLRVQVSSGGGTFPVAGARVVVFRLFGGLAHLFYQGSTDISGLATDITLPALPPEPSQSAEQAERSGTDYLVTVEHPLFVSLTEQPVTVFARIETILPVLLEPTT